LKPPTKPKRIGILTSGGDAPGMNAAIRAVVRTSAYKRMNVVGFKRGFEGLLHGQMIEMNARSVSDIIHRGGTMLLTARCEEMLTEEGQRKAAGFCEILEIDALIVIGGDGSFQGALALSKLGVPVIGIPATIDLDIPCTDYTIGFDTAINNGMEAINKIRDTSSSHERCSVVEVMGRAAGHIALWCSLTGGAEEALIPENPGWKAERVIQQVIENRAKGKTQNLIVVAEGVGGTQALAREIQAKTGIEARATILGHLQRGGSPTAVDRMHASVMGYRAVELIEKNELNRILIYKDGKHSSLPIEEALAVKGKYTNEMYEMIKILAI